jgi:hypothetical protein
MSRADTQQHDWSSDLLVGHSMTAGYERTKQFCCCQEATLTTTVPLTQTQHKTVYISVSLWNDQNCVTKAVPVHARKAWVGGRGAAPIILNLGTRWRWVVSFTPLHPNCFTPRSLNPLTMCVNSMPGGPQRTRANAMKWTLERPAYTTVTILLIPSHLLNVLHWFMLNSQLLNVSCRFIL